MSEDTLPPIRLCRLCLALTNTYVDIVENQELSMMLTALTSIQLEPNDEISTKSCFKCRLNLRLAYRIQQNILQAEQRFCLQTNKSPSLVTEEIMIKEETLDTLENEEEEQFDAVVKEENKECDTVVKDETEEQMEDVDDEQQNERVCEICGKEFQHKILMQRHRSIHKKEVAKARAELLNTNSKERYEGEYRQFCEWRERRKAKTVTDDVLLLYLAEKAKVIKSSTLWSRFSMLKNCLAVKENLDASRFPKTAAFLKRQSVGYVPKKSKVLTAGQVSDFISNAPDEKWLLVKVLLIFSVFGACRRDDLIGLTVNDVEDNGRFLVVFLRDDKNHKARSFTIVDEGCPFQPCKFFRKYVSLRPSKLESKRLFIAYRNGKCYNQHVGCHTISGVTREIAKYLKLENPQEYTGHGLRRSSGASRIEIPFQRYGP